MPTSTHQHRTAAVLAIGDELVSGRSLDTNSRWIASALADLGVETLEHATVRDEPHLVRDALERLANRSDLVIATGGLGPTADDLTRDALAELLGDTLVRDHDQHERLRARYEKRRRTLADDDRQTLYPASGQMLTNNHGTAPGIRATHTNADGHPCDIFLLPGPPNEMQPMFAADVAPFVRTPSDSVIRFRAIQHFGIGESDAARTLGDILDRNREPLVGITASDGVITTRIRYHGPPADADEKLDATDLLINERLGDFRIATDGGPLPTLALDALKAAKHGVITAESCTAGMLAAALTDAGGSSAAVLGGWVTYADQHKIAHLGVDPEALNAHGAVSHEVAQQMALGALAHAPTPKPSLDLTAVHAIAITGIAGPGGEVRDRNTNEIIKPVGTVYIAHAHAQITNGQIDHASAAITVRRFEFPGDRERVRARTVASAAAILLFTALGRSAPTPMLWEHAPQPAP